MKNEVPDLRAKLFEFRNKAGMSRRQLSKASGVVIHTLNNIEENRHVPNVRTLARISDALGVRLRDWFD